ncbi:HAD family hydrolase [Alphaproteobacteria bacterium]|nr:HAD family hydrolase [Alphaproteobacteria bacterium]
MADILDRTVCLKPKIILFDWDGVLVDTKDLIKEAYLRTFKELDQEPLPIDTLHQLPGTSLRDYFPRIFGKHASKAEEIFYKYVHENHLSCLKRTENSKELLEFIASLNIPMAVVSNKRGDLLRKEIKHLEFESFFFDVVGSKDCSEDKPSDVPVRHVLGKKNISLPNEKIWFIGDWTADMECAHASGIVPILFNNLSLKNSKKNPFPPKIYVNSCLDLKNLLIQYIEGGN